MSAKVRKAVFPAAGLGTRFLPATKASPKEMLPLVDKPLIQYSVEEAVASGCESILIITGRDKTAIEDHFDDAGFERSNGEHGRSWRRCCRSNPRYCFDCLAHERAFATGNG